MTPNRLNPSGAVEQRGSLHTSTGPKTDFVALAWPALVVPVGHVACCTVSQLYVPLASVPQKGAPKVETAWGPIGLP